MKAAILSFLLAQPWHITDRAETVEHRTERFGHVAAAISHASRGDRLIAGALVELARAESGFRRDVQFGACPEHECDRGRARGLWQLHRPPTVDESVWMSWAGDTYESQLAAAERAAGLVRWGMQRCGTLDGALGLYATGLVCDEKVVAGRAQRAREIARKL